jgi:transcriptional regulator of acetoin/glycerol metabolism
MLNLANGKIVCPEHLPEEMLSPNQVNLPLKNSSFSTKMEGNTKLPLEKQKIRELIYQSEHRELTYMLLAAKGNLSQVAREMGVSRNTLYKKLRRLNISIR